MLDDLGDLGFRVRANHEGHMKTNARAVWDQEQIARAVEFTTSRFLGRGVFDTRRFRDLALARTDAAGDRRAMVFAVTPEGWTVHIANGDAIPTSETTMTTTKTYATKQDAIRSARAALKAKHRDAISGVHFRLNEAGGEWAWHELDVSTGQMAIGELIEDGAQAATDLPPVTQVPAKASGKTKPAKTPAPKLAADTRSPKQRKLDAAAQAKGFPNAARMNDAMKAAKTAERAARPKAEKPASKRAEIQAAAERGEMPTAPDFSADTHKRFRKTLDALVAAAGAGDIKTLKADKTEPKSSSRVTLCRYRDLAIVALEAQKKLAKAA